MNFGRVKWLWLLVCLCTAAAARAERLPLNAYTVVDGLRHNQVNKIVRDSLGYLWFCTSDGLSRYDGYGFTDFGMDQGQPHPKVTNILETREGEYSSIFRELSRTMSRQTLLVLAQLPIFGARAEREIQRAPASLIASGSCEVFLDHGA